MLHITFSDLKEYFVAAIITLSTLIAGTHIGWTSPSLPQLLSGELFITITQDDSSWIASLYLVGSIAGPFTSVFLVNRIGRKISVLLSGIPFLIAWILILVAESAPMLYVARFVGGIGNGVAMSLVPLYLGEIASVKIRGVLGTLLTVMYKFGAFLPYCIGPYVEFDTLSYILMTIPILFMIGMYWVPETPIYYLTKHKEEEAMKSLKSLRPGKTEKDLESELEEMYKVVKRNEDSKVSIKELFSSEVNRSGLWIICACYTGLNVSGNPAYLSYTQQIFDSAESAMDAAESSIIIGAVQVFVTFISAAIADKVGRRILLLCSSLGVTITNLLMGIYFYYKDYLKADMSSFTWAPLVIFICYIILYNIGLSTVTFDVLGELFATNIKTIAATTAIIYTSVLAFTIIKLYQVVRDALGSYVTFWSFSVLSAAVLIFLFFKLPETKGVSLNEIQEQLVTRNKKSKAYR